ncbi:Glutaredoxin-C6 [Glycine soja]|uniref:Glutaredoxin-C6 n=1 Tax=Glycine soja TaxID=3848 RepID=A0A445GAF0_GLYSO|nr:Glutaredoxin-C6 [Glycine soja]
MQGLRRCSNDVVQLDLSTPTTTTTTTTTTTNNTNSSSFSSSCSLSIDVDESTEARIQRLISEHPVIIFTRSSCCMCHVMKKLLATIGVNPTVIELDDHEIAALPLPDHRTPAVFIGGSSVGGLESLVALHVSGHLVPKLVQVGALWDVTGGSMFHSANSLTSCGNNLSNDEAEPPRNVSNLHGDEDDDDDDDDYLVSNSYVEESLDEDDNVDGVEQIQNPFWNDALHYNNINWSHPDEEYICGLEMPSTFNVGQKLYVGMDFDSIDAVKKCIETICYEGMIREDSSIKVSLIQESINSGFAYKVSYKKSWMAKQKVIAIEYGDWEESYAKLSSWLTHMQNHSPGSYFQILHDDFIVGNMFSREHRQFHRVFWTFGQCKEAFKYCKQIIQVDSIHLYGKYCGTLLMVTSQDGNGGVLPLAFIMVEGYTPCKHIFDQNLETFRQLSLAIATWIDRISKEKWTMTYDKEGCRYGHMTTNLSECINKVLKDCRNIPITTLVKSTYSRCRKYFVNCVRQAQRQLNEGQIYCSKLVKELRKNQEQACLHIVRVYGIQSIRFEVEDTFNPITQRDRQKWAVNLNGHYCQYKKYSTIHYPCSHIIATCDYVSMNYYQYIDVVYTNEHILKAYSAQRWPLGIEAAIPPSDDAWTLIPDPITIRAKARPKSTRIRNEMDWLEPSQQRQKCSRCGAEGHNRRRCRMQSERGSCSFN